MTKCSCNIVSARLWPAAIFAEDDLAISEVANNARLNSIEADETQTSHDLFERQEFGERMFIPQAVLESQNCGMFRDQWWQQGWKFRIRGGF